MPPLQPPLLWPQEWNYCLDVTTILSAPNMTQKTLQKYIGPDAGATSLLHAGMHWGVGSQADLSGAGEGPPWL